MRLRQCSLVIAAITAGIGISIGGSLLGQVTELPTKIIDNSDRAGSPAPFTEEGRWLKYKSSLGFRKSFDISHRNWASVARWAFPVDEGAVYVVEATWPALGVLSTNVPYVIKDRNTVIGTFVINQRKLPNGPIIEGKRWQQIGSAYRVGGPTLTVEVSSAFATKWVAVDAIRITRTRPACDANCQRERTVTLLTTETQKLGGKEQQIFASAAPRVISQIGEAIEKKGYAESLDTDGDGKLTSGDQDRVQQFVIDAANPVCGNGALQEDIGEQCDDGGSISGDRCSGEGHPNGGCSLEFCGDMYLDENGYSDQDGAAILSTAESCDDGGVCSGGKNDGNPCTELGESSLCGEDSLCAPVGGDGCSMTCSIEQCGDGEIDTDGPDNIADNVDDEACDDENTMNGDGCSAQCAVEEGFMCEGEPSTCSPVKKAAPVCGDGTSEDPEECDDGNLVSGDGCSGADHPNGGCFIEFCGDGYADSDGILAPNGERVYEEQCDDASVCFGGTNGGKPCSSSGGPLMEEQCPGNGTCVPVSFDGCASNCLLEICGNASFEPDGSDAKPGKKGIDDNGDGIIDNTAERWAAGTDDEECDDGGDCLLNGMLFADHSCISPSQADLCRQDGGTCVPKSGDGCSMICRTERCGDGVHDPDGIDNKTGTADDEECDDGNTTNGDSCTSTCKEVVIDPMHTKCDGLRCISVLGDGPNECETAADCTSSPVCGNGMKEATEQCDDGTKNGQACTPQYGDTCQYCSSQCTLVTVNGGRCGDEGVQAPEECDDGQKNGQACTPNYGSSCTYCSSQCTKTTVQGGSCGDGKIESAEKCDDGAKNGTVCTPQYGLTCNYCTKTCAVETVTGPRCGDGKIESGRESCDDGNTAKGDGCSESCAVENGFVCTGAPSTCKPTIACSDTVDNDGDGGIDFANMGIVTQDQGKEVWTQSWQGFPILARGERLYTLEDGIVTYNMQTGVQEGKITFGNISTRYAMFPELLRRADHQKSGMLYLFEESDIQKKDPNRIYKVDVHGTAQLAGSLNIGEGGYTPSLPTFTQDGQKMYVQLSEHITGGGRPTVLVEIDTATMTILRQKEIPSGIFFIDEMRQKVYIVGNRTVHELDLQTLTATRKTAVTFSTLDRYDPTLGLFIGVEFTMLGNNGAMTRVVRFSAEKFAEEPSISIHGGSTFRFEGENYNRVTMHILSTDAALQRAYVIAQYQNTSGQSRSVFMTINIGSAPGIHRLMTDVPTVKSSGYLWNLIRHFDEKTHMAYLTENGAQRESDGTTNSFALNMETGTVFKSQSNTMAQSMFVGTDESKRELLFVPGNRLLFMKWYKPTVRMNLGDSACASAQDTNESE